MVDYIGINYENLNKIEHSVKDLEHFEATNPFFTLKIHYLFRVNFEYPRVFLFNSVM